MADEDDPNPQVLGLDAPLVDEIENRVIPALAHLEAQNNKLAKSFENFGDSLGENFSQSFTEIDKKGNIFLTTLSKLEDGWNANSRLISINEKTLRAYSASITDVDEKTQLYTRALIRQFEIAEKIQQQDALHINQVERQGGEFQDTGATVGSKSINRRTNRDYSEQDIQTQEQLNELINQNITEKEELEKLANQLVERETQLASVYEQEVTTQKNLVTAATQLEAKLADTITQQKLSIEEEARKTVELEHQNSLLLQASALRSEQASNIANKIKAGLPENLDPSQQQRVAVAIGQITKAINDEKISAEEAEAVISSTAKGEAAEYEGAAGRISNAFQRIKRITSQPQATDPFVESNRKLIQSFEETEEAGTKSAFRISLSWEQLWKLFLIQSLHTLVRKFFESLKETIETTEQLEIRISEIQTISQGAQQTTDEWAHSIRELSNEFGSPALDVAEGMYQTISNKIAQGAEATGFLRQAMEFAKLTVSSTKDSVNLLSSALNSYHENVDQTNHDSAILFETITQGRVRAEEMANTFGHVTALAAPLGVSLENLGATIDTLGNKGIKYAEVQTLITSVMRSLIKPSEDMQKILDSWGTHTGQAAIATFGWIGTLEKLSKVSDGSLAEVADQFKNIRATIGDAALSGSFKEFQDNLDNINIKAAQDAAKGLQITMQTDAQELIEQGQRIKNFFSAGFGETFVHGIVEISKALSDEGLVGVVKNLITSGEVLGFSVSGYFLALKAKTAAIAISTIVTKADTEAQIVNTQSERLWVVADQERQAAENLRVAATLKATAVTEAETIATEEEVIALREESIAAEQSATAQELAAYAAGMNAAALETETTASILASSALKGLGAILSNPVFLFTAAIAGISYFIVKMHEAEHAAEEAFKAAHEVGIRETEKLTQELNIELAKQETDFRNHLDAEYREYGLFEADVLKLFDRIVETQKDNLKETVDATKEAISVMLKNYENLAKGTEDANKRALDAILKLQDDIEKSAQSFADRQFQRQMKEAQAKDKAEGIKHPVDEEQTNLINARIKTLQDQNQQLETATNTLINTLAQGKIQGGSPEYIDKTKTIDNNKALIEKNFKELEQLNESSHDRRLSIEREHQRTKEQLDEAIAKRTKDLALQANQSQENDLKDTLKKTEELRKEAAEKQKRTRNPALALSNESFREEETPLKDEETDTQRNSQKIRNDDQKREDDRHIAELQTQFDAQTKGLNLLPEINALNKTAENIEKQKTDYLERQVKAQESLVAIYKSQEEAQKSSIQPLRVALQQIEKFKTDAKLVFNSDNPDAANVKRDTDFGQLITNAQKAAPNGNLDTSVLEKLINERTALEKAGEIETAKFKAEKLQQDTLNNKTAREERFKDENKKLEEMSAKTKELTSPILGLVGRRDQQGKFVEGSLSKSLGFFTDNPFDNTNKTQKKLSELIVLMQKSESEYIKDGTPFREELITSFKQNIQKLAEEASLQSRTEQHSGDLTRLPGGTIEGKFGEQIPVTAQQRINTLETFARHFAETIAQEQVAKSSIDTEKAKGDAQDAVTKKQVEDLAKQFNFNISEVDQSTKSFHDLNDEMPKIIDGFKNLKLQLDKFAPPGQTSSNFGVGFNSTLTPIYPQLPSVAQAKTTYNFGDINFHGIASDPAKINLREVASNLKNMIRRGDISFDVATT